MDTWRLVFQAFLGGPDESGGWHVPGKVFSIGDRVLSDGSIERGNYRGQYFGEYNVLAVEGHPRRGGLCPADSLEQAYADVIAELDENDIRPTGFRGVSRLDVTCTQRFADPMEGRAMLVGLAALDVPGCKQVVYGKPVETVGIMSNRGRRLLGRIYDKGVEAGWVDEGREELRQWAQRGEYLRLEEQGRFGSQRRPGREHVSDPGYLKTRFERRFVPLWQSSKGLKVAGLPVLTETLIGRVRSGELTVREAERVGGFLVMESSGEAKERYSRSVYYRRQRELREMGLVLADEFYEPVEVRLADVLERALDTPLWG